MRKIFLGAVSLAAVIACTDNSSSSAEDSPESSSSKTISMSSSLQKGLYTYNQRCETDSTGTESCLPSADSISTFTDWKADTATICLNDACEPVLSKEIQKDSSGVATHRYETETQIYTIINKRCEITDKSSGNVTILVSGSLQKIVQ